jgi:hypothetical protein
MKRKPLCIDVFCGLGGWAEGFLAEGWDVIGFDIEQHVYGPHSYPGQLVIQDALTLHGSQFKTAHCLVMSPPCQFFSYTAMPWSKAKALAKQVRADPARREKELALFNACFRIQREASDAAGHHIPMVVENVKGAQPWVGRARWLFGSFALWGDVPALMPITSHAKVGGFSWSDYGKPDYKPLAFNGEADRRLREGMKVPGFRFNGRSGSFQSASVEGMKSDGGSWFGDYGQMVEGIKQRGSGREWFAGDGKISRMTSSKSPARKMASAMIAKIPLTLSRHIARTFYPN